MVPPDPTTQPFNASVKFTLNKSLLEGMDKNDHVVSPISGFHHIAITSCNPSSLVIKKNELMKRKEQRMCLAFANFCPPSVVLKIDPEKTGLLPNRKGINKIKIKNTRICNS
jgi:hypothetical protein